MPKHGALNHNGRSGNGAGDEQAQDNYQTPRGVQVDDVAVDEESHEQRHRDGGHQAHHNGHENVNEARSRLQQDGSDHPA